MSTICVFCPFTLLISSFIKVLAYFYQDWFTECARLISQVCGQNVEWLTPLGLPVVQPYSRPNKKLEAKSSTQKIKEHYALDMFE
jgi:DNA-directed RNA polymerase